MEEDDGLLLNLAGTNSSAGDNKASKARSNPWIRKQERREKALVWLQLGFFLPCFHALTRPDRTLRPSQDARKKQRKDLQPHQKQPAPKAAASALKGYSLDAPLKEEPHQDAPQGPPMTQERNDASTKEGVSRLTHPGRQNTKPDLGRLQARGQGGPALPSALHALQNACTQPLALAVRTWSVPYACKGRRRCTQPFP